MTSSFTVIRLSVLPLTLHCLQALIFKKSINEKERKRVLRERKICKKNCTKLCYSICSRDSLCSRKGYHSISIVIIDLDISLTWSIVFFDYSDAVVWEDAFFVIRFLVSFLNWRKFHWHHVVSSFDRPSWTPSDCKQTIAAACSAAFLLHSLKQHNNNNSIITGRGSGKFSKKTCCVQVKPVIQTSIWILTSRINYNKSVTLVILSIAFIFEIISYLTNKEA